MRDLTARQALYEQTTATWGADAQLGVVIEELCEAAREVSRCFSGRYSRAALIDEFADARICIEQVEQIFGVQEAVALRMEEKLTRLEERLKNG